MKKLSLKNLKLEANDMLQRNQLKSVLGGGHGGFAVRNVEPTGEAREYNGGVWACWCTWQVNNYDGQGWINTSGPCPPPYVYSCTN
jgi:hypothetical protein